MMEGHVALAHPDEGNRRDRVRLRGWRRRFVLFAAAAAILLVPAGCGGAPTGGDQSTKELMVFAAASLAGTFRDIAHQFQMQHPDVLVILNFAGSQELVAQLEQGASASVLATADQETMQKVSALVGEPRVFATNGVQIVVARGNPEKIQSLADLAREDLKVVLAAPSVPVGGYAAEILAKADVTVKPVSLEDNVKAVVTKVSLGEADAGIVYVTDVSVAGGTVEGVAIPADVNVEASYPIAVVTAGEHQQAAQDFVNFVLAAEGQRILRGDGFMPVTEP